MIYKTLLENLTIKTLLQNTEIMSEIIMIEFAINFTHPNVTTARTMLMNIHINNYVHITASWCATIETIFTNSSRFIKVLKCTLPLPIESTTKQTFCCTQFTSNVFLHIS